MRSFNKERTTQLEITSDKYKFPIPAFYVTPETITEDSCVFVFVSGISFPITSSIYLNNDFYNKHWFVTYDKMGQGANKNKSSQFRKPYVDELEIIVKWAKNQFPNRKIYLLGESWGGAIIFSFLRKHSDLVSGGISWNVPIKPKDPNKNTTKIKFICAIKEICTLLTNISLELPVVQKTQEQVSNNPLFIRAMSLFPQKRQDSRSTISVWRYMHSSKLFLKRHTQDKRYNYLYIQSGDDALSDLKFMKKLAKKSLHCTLIPTGKHVLSLEPVESKQLYEIIQRFIEAK